MATTQFSSLMLVWYREHARSFPWRAAAGEPSNPYAVWVSEIMLQQTRTESVEPYFRRWMSRFPNLQTLAESSLDDVLAAWEGLGYYSRARNLHRSARIVQDTLRGSLPEERASLLRLPGIGAYSASAIASIAFGKDEFVLDGNVRRVLARVFNVEHPLGSKEAEGALEALAAAHLPHGMAGDYNQALMDLGATICLPRNPYCTECPVHTLCEAYRNDLQQTLPVRPRKQTVPLVHVAAGVIRRGERVLIGRRAEKGLLGGLWEFPGGKLQDGEDYATALRRELCEELSVPARVGDRVGTYRHAFTHFRIHLQAYHCTLEEDAEPAANEHTALAWVVTAGLGDYPMGKIDRLISQDLQAAEAR